MKLLVTHPGRQHSHQAALALEGAGMLAGYWAGVPAVAQQARWVPVRLRRHFARYEPVPIDPRRVRWFPATPALRRLGEAALPPGAAAWIDFLACRLFDCWSVSGLPRAGADAVMACEISALSTFRAARRLGMVTLLDAPSLHHQAQDRLRSSTDPPRLHRRITEIKDREIALADYVLTVSPLARETYVAAGVAPKKVLAVPLGADLDLFTPGPGRQGRAGSFVFLFSGATSRHKGFDLLLDAFARVAAVDPGARLRIAGPQGDQAHLLAAQSGPRIAYLGKVGQRDLARELRQADCLVLPSRYDSYGMVVPEALASGVPVLISEMVGAKELVAPGCNGWIVPADDIAALAAQMSWCTHNAVAVGAMRGQCRRAAEAASWPAYHRRLIELLRSVVPKRVAA